MYPSPHLWMSSYPCGAVKLQIQVNVPCIPHPPTATDWHPSSETEGQVRILWVPNSFSFLFLTKDSGLSTRRSDAFSSERSITSTQHFAKHVPHQPAWGCSLGGKKLWAAPPGWRAHFPGAWNGEDGEERGAGKLTVWGGQRCPHPARCPGSGILPRAESGSYTDPAPGLSGLSKTSCPNPWSSAISSPQMSLGAQQAAGNG